MPILGSIIKKAYELRNIPYAFKNKTDAYTSQKKVLLRLLKKAQHTAFGEHYKFNEMLKKEDFINAYQQQVPIYDYNSMFRRWWYRALNGEAYVSWPGRIKYFALTSGTS